MNIITTLLALPALALALPLLAAPPTARDTLYPSLSGAWTGTLEYKDYQPPHGRVRLPTTATIETAPDRSSVQLHLVYDDGAGKIVKSEQRLAIDPAGDTLVWTALPEGKAQSYTVRALITTAGTTTLTAEGEGTDDDKPVTLRETFTIASDSLQILRETRQKGATAFAFRHVYALKRKP
jgi:hypothetical protein